MFCFFSNFFFNLKNIFSYIEIGFIMDRNEKEATFENLYLTYFSKLKHFAKAYVQSEEEAENIVQDVFSELWEKRAVCFCYANMESYLFISAKNRCLNYLRHQAVIRETSDKIQEEYRLKLQASFNSLEILDLNFLSERPVDKILETAIDSLPEKCRRIFIMSKIEGKKQKDIADRLNISVNTVETQMGVAYRYLRERLKDCFLLLSFICFC